MLLYTKRWSITYYYLRLYLGKAFDGPMSLSYNCRHRFLRIFVPIKNNNGPKSLQSFCSPLDRIQYSSQNSELFLQNSVVSDRKIGTDGVWA